MTDTPVALTSNGLAQLSLADAIDRMIARLGSDDPDFDDCTAAVVLLYRCKAELVGPEGFTTWKDAAIHERQLRRSTHETCDQRWIRQARGTLDKLYAFLQAKNVPHAVDTREWIDNALRVLDAYEPTSEKALEPLQAETRAATSRGCSSTEDAGRPGSSKSEGDPR